VKSHTLALAPGPVIVFGGPYSNLAATQAMRALAGSKQIPASNCICTGDLVAYCGQPLETVELIRDWGVAVVMGNCEESLAQTAPDCGCGFDSGTACATLSDQWYRFAAQRIDAATRTWMRQLPRMIEFEIQHRKVCVIHGGVRRINQFIYPSTSQSEKLSQFTDQQANIIIGGHSGLPFGESLGQSYWLNSGAIGMPANDGTPDGWYLLLDPDGGRLHACWHRLQYDALSEQQVMLERGLDNGYAQALLTGLWPSMDVLPTEERSMRGQPLRPESMVLY
jgi:predicted phosphodiesterase